MPVWCAGRLPRWATKQGSFILSSFLIFLVFPPSLFFFKASIIDESTLRLSLNLSFKSTWGLLLWVFASKSEFLFQVQVFASPCFNHLVSLEIVMHPRALLSRGNCDPHPFLFWHNPHKIHFSRYVHTRTRKCWILVPGIYIYDIYIYTWF